MEHISKIMEYKHCNSHNVTHKASTIKMTHNTIGLDTHLNSPNCINYMDDYLLTNYIECHKIRNNGAYFKNNGV